MLFRSPDFLLASIPASRGALAPFRLCSRRQPQSSPCDPTETRASAPSPAHPGGGADKPLRLVSAARHRSSVWKSIHCALRIPVAALSSVALKLPPSTTCSLCPRRGFLVCGNLSSFMGGDCRRWRGEASEPRRRAQPQGCRGQSGEIPAQRISAAQHSPAREACMLTHRGRWGLGAEARALVGLQGEDLGWLREHSLKGLVCHS